MEKRKIDVSKSLYVTIMVVVYILSI